MTSALILSLLLIAAVGFFVLKYFIHNRKRILLIINRSNYFTNIFS